MSGTHVPRAPSSEQLRELRCWACRLLNCRPMFRPTLRVWHSLLLLIACGGSVAKTSEPGAAGAAGAAGTMAGSAPAGSGGNSGADMTTTGPMSTTVAAGGGGYGGSGYGGGGGDGNRCPGQSWGIDCGNGRACCQTPGVGGVPPWCCGLDGGPGGSASDDGGPVATWIAFDSDAQGGTRDIYIVHPDGSGLRRLTVGFSAIEPAFRPTVARSLLPRRSTAFRCKSPFSIFEPTTSFP